MLGESMTIQLFGKVQTKTQGLKWRTRDAIADALNTQYERQNPSVMSDETLALQVEGYKHTNLFVSQNWQGEPRTSAFVRFI